MIRTKNRFDRQVEVCQGLKLGFRSLGDLIADSGTATSWMPQNCTKEIH